MPEVAITDTIREDSLVIALDGDLDLLTTAKCAQRLTDALTERPPGCHLVAVDLRDVDFCGAIGLRMLTTFAAECVGRSLAVGVLAVRPGAVTRIFEVTGIDRILPVAETIDELMPILPLPMPRTAG